MGTRVSKTKTVNNTGAGTKKMMQLPLSQIQTPKDSQLPKRVSTQTSTITSQQHVPVGVSVGGGHAQHSKLVRIDSARFQKVLDRQGYQT